MELAANLITNRLASSFERPNGLQSVWLRRSGQGRRPEAVSPAERTGPAARGPARDLPCAPDGWLNTLGRLRALQGMEAETDAELVAGVRRGSRV